MAKSSKDYFKVYVVMPLECKDALQKLAGNKTMSKFIAECVEKCTGIKTSLGESQRLQYGKNKKEADRLGYFSIDEVAHYANVTRAYVNYHMKDFSEYIREINGQKFFDEGVFKKIEKMQKEK